MILVVADTSPLRYLVEIEHIELLPRIYDVVLIPSRVHRELGAEQGLPLVREWAERLPSWVRVEDPRTALRPLAGIHEGECAAITLAEELGVTLLIDDRAGARLARQRGVTITGTLGILVAASQMGLIDIDDAVAKLATTTFRGTPGLFDHARQLGRRPGR